MQKQLFISEISCNFNLRRPKVVNKPTNVYCVVYVGGKQHYFATGLKVLPSQWNKKKQIAEVSNTLTTLDNRNNNILNEKINQLRGYYKEYIEYLCSNPNDTDKLCNFIYKDMNMKKPRETKEKATDLLERALEIYKSKSKSLSTATLRGYENKMNAFKKYIKDSKVDDNLKLLTQRGINDYQEYLQREAAKVKVGENGGGKEGINQKCQFIARLINKVLCSNNEFLNLSIQSVKYDLIKRDKKNKENGIHFPLDKEEIRSFSNVTNLNEKQILYRDIFVLQCNCGQRVSDLKQLIMGNYTKNEDNYILLKTQKESTTAYIYETEKIKEILDKLKTHIIDYKGKTCLKAGEYRINLDNLDNDPQYNEAIKLIAEKANLNRNWDYKDAQDRPLSNPIYKIISSHCARHTFATIMRDKGYPADKVCWLLGHADDTMVKQVYAHNDEKLITKQLNETRKTIEREDKTKTDALQSLFAYDRLKELERMKDNGINILPLSNKCISIIKDTSNLKKAIQLMNTASKEKKEEFINKVKELDKIIWYIAKHTADTTLYSIYEYKIKELGIIDKVTDINLLDYMFEQELRDEEEEYYSDEAQAERHFKNNW
ncbi:tyrosine-type recombinase/integrase [Prevotella melaninogenica]|uniref:tyrosine-type recombinase/integrase n=1 Tax=Prevotella melaninogenica TaxID=28132 RepID=UPI001BA514F1|nr:tyrosine-type recombinase/integrase [Prevotella melaninogenica]QUB62655.1 tyrosine-type recombinase/integrase [Prevotella melaninogenica]